MPWSTQRISLGRPRHPLFLADAPKPTKLDPCMAVANQEWTRRTLSLSIDDGAIVLLPDKRFFNKHARGGRRFHRQLVRLLPIDAVGRASGGNENARHGESATCTHDSRRIVFRSNKPAKPERALRTKPSREAASSVSRLERAFPCVATLVSWPFASAYGAALYEGVAGLAITGGATGGREPARLPITGLAWPGSLFTSR